jgi:bidirectional [NiFe] hydrogenase diaphorase subunit
MVTMTIDGQEVNVAEGTTILEAAREAGVRIPTLCHHKELSPSGACRVCLVEIVKGGRPGLQASCLYTVTDGLEVKTETERVKKTRKIVFELLLARAPNSETIRRLAEEYGVTGTRITLRNHDDCILCGLCVRACAEISQRRAINFAFRGRRRRVQTAFNGIASECIGCGACVHLCPTGAIAIEEAE